MRMAKIQKMVGGKLPPSLLWWQNLKKNFEWPLHKRKIYKLAKSEQKTKFVNCLEKIFKFMS